jgi:hypothetical protein
VEAVSVLLVRMRGEQWSGEAETHRSRDLRLARARTGNARRAQYEHRTFWKGHGAHPGPESLLDSVLPDLRQPERFQRSPYLRRPASNSSRRATPPANADTRTATIAIAAMRILAEDGEGSTMAGRKGCPRNVGPEPGGSTPQAQEVAQRANAGQGYQATLSPRQPPEKACHVPSRGRGGLEGRRESPLRSART